MSEITLKLTAPPIAEEFVADWQRWLNKQSAAWGIDYRIKVDGVYGIATRDWSQSIRRGLGILPAASEHGFTPDLRSKMRNKRLSPTELARFHGAELVDYRERLARKHAGGGVAPPLAKIITHANGWSGAGGHDGVDLITTERAPGFAVCNAVVVRADAAGWWGKNAPRDPDVLARGDGIVIIRPTANVGPFRTNMHVCYGHAEHARFDVGQHVKAGEWICEAGTAVVPHFHFMLNVGKFRSDGVTPSGVGDRDPWPFVAFCIANA